MLLTFGFVLPPIPDSLITGGFGGSIAIFYPPIILLPLLNSLFFSSSYAF
jgi:hypothetical protein